MKSWVGTKNGVREKRKEVTVVAVGGLIVLFIPAIAHATGKKQTPVVLLVSRGYKKPICSATVFLYLHKIRQFSFDEHSDSFSLISMLTNPHYDDGKASVYCVILQKPYFLSATKMKAPKHRGSLPSFPHHPLARWNHFDPSGFVSLSQPSSIFTHKVFP